MTVAPLPLPEADVRSAPRTNLFLSATICFDSTSAAVRIRNLSSSGAHIEGPKLPNIGASAVVNRGNVRATGTIVWREGQACGIRFDGPLPLEDWIPSQTDRDQHKVDQMVALVRSGETGAPKLPRKARAQAGLGEVLPGRLAEELACVVRALTSMGEDLAGEAVVLARYAAVLQNLDLSVEILRHVAAILTAPDPVSAVDGINMESLRRRLRRVAL